MTSKKSFQKPRDSQNQVHLSEAEIADLIQKTAQQYEECMRLADLTDVPTADRISRPKYSWDNPIGLVVAGASNAKLG